jgi:predicted DNA-binding mobile mystery protein A
MGKFTAKLRRKQLDESLNKYKEIQQPSRGYIREIREALEMSSYQLADRLNISQPAVFEMEENERRGAISLRTLERAAQALGCKVVYALVPEKPLEQMVIDQAHLRAQKLSETVFRTMALEKQSTGADEETELINELSAELLRKGGRELWKRDDQ